VLPFLNRNSFLAFILGGKNTTFGGIQGFTRKPSTPFTDDAGNFAGIVHQERNITYALFTGAGHLVPMSVPEAVSDILSICIVLPSSSLPADDDCDLNFV
jgi:hypothetical protein